MIYVYDASFIGALIIPDEKDPEVDRLHALVRDDEEVFVPQLLWYEISNIFRNLTLRGRYAYNDVLGFFPALRALRLTTDFESGAEYSEKILRIGQELGLTAYDAAYVELAGRKKARLCVLDNNLREAAEQYGVDVLKQP